MSQISGLDIIDLDDNPDIIDLEEGLGLGIGIPLISLDSWNDYSSETNAVKYTRRHNDVSSYFSENSELSSFTLVGNKLGLKYSSNQYTIHKFITGDTINIIENKNYIPISGENNYIVVKYNSTYFKITQTSILDNDESLYKCEISLNNDSNFNLVCSNKSFGDSYTYDNIEIVFGGAEFIVNDRNEICFHEDTLIDTDQGQIKIKNLKSFHTIDGNDVLYLIKSETEYEELVLIKKDAFDINSPNKNIMLTENHLISVNNMVKPVHKLLNNESILKIKNHNKSRVYNIILLNSNFINVNNLKVNVIGISKKSCDSLDGYKSEGIDNLDLKFSKNTVVNLKLSKFKNF